jgi:RimJ/RimL family protein N-acetyltransferase
VRAWAATQGLADLVSYIRPGNVASIALARKLGARYERDIDLLAAAEVWRHGPPPVELPTPAAPSVFDVPILETPRLVLRRFQLADYDALCAIHADAETMRYLGDGKPRDPALTFAQMCLWTGAHALGRGGWFAIIRRADGAFMAVAASTPSRHGRSPSSPTPSHVRIGARASRGRRRPPCATGPGAASPRRPS